MHQVVIEGRLRIKPGVPAAELLAIVAPFATRHNLELAARLPDTKSDYIDLLDVRRQSSVFSVDRVSGEHDHLCVSLECWSKSGSDPDEAESLWEGINKVLVDRGVLEIADTNVVPSSDASVVPRFLGIDEAQRRLAKCEYGLELAHGYVAAAIGETAWSKLATEAMAVALSGPGDGETSDDTGAPQDSVARERPSAG